MTAAAPPPRLGIFVGGAARRMGGRPKGLLRAPGGESSIVERWRSLATTVGLRAVLVGEAGAYAHLGMETVADERPGAGPLAGLVGLLRSATERKIVAVACDMPYVTAALLKRLAFAESDSAVLAPFREDRYEPLFARYDRASVLPLAERQLAGGDRSLQKLIRDAGAEAVILSDEEWLLLADWDEPGDAAG